MGANREILMKFITQQNEKVKQDISMQGYKDDSPYRNNPSNTIYGTPQGTAITMQGVSTPLVGMDEFGNRQEMFPGQEYKYPGSRVVETPMAQRGLEVPKRRGVRLNYDDKGNVVSESTHKMATETDGKGNWFSFPTLFQNSIPYEDDSENWVDMSDRPWEEAYQEAKRRDEVIEFGNDKEAAINFGKGSWKPKKKLGGALLDKTIKCSNCRWSWKAADGGNDVSTCHKCGNENVIMQEGGPASDIKSWFSQYIQSPNYKKNLENSEYENVDAEISKRLSNIDKTKYVIDENRLGTYYNPGSRYIHHSPMKDVENWEGNAPESEYILAHEFGHSGVAKGPGTRLNKNDIEQLGSRNKNKKSYPGENYADQKALQYEAAKLGIYDPGTQEFTQEHLDELKNTGHKSRALENYSDEDLIWLMNNIAEVDNQSPLPIGQTGGQKKPIYVESKNDPRYIAFKDSLILSTKGDEWFNNEFRKKDGHPLLPQERVTNALKNKPIGKKKIINEIGEVKKHEVHTINGRKVSDAIIDTKKNQSFHYKNIYAAPEQEVIVKPTTTKETTKPNSRSNKRKPTEKEIKEWSEPGFKLNSVTDYINPKTKKVGQSWYGDLTRNEQAIQNNLKPEGLIQSEIELSADMSGLRPVARIPKYYDVEDVVNNGKSQTNYRWYPENNESLRELSEEEGDKRTMVPRYQIGGQNMYTTSGNPIVIPTQGSYPTSYQYLPDNMQPIKVPRKDINGIAIPTNVLRENQKEYNTQRMVQPEYGYLNRMFDWMEENNATEKDWLKKLKKEEKQNSKYYQQEGTCDPNFSSTSCPISKEAAKEEKKQWNKRKYGGSWFGNADEMSVSNKYQIAGTVKTVPTWNQNNGNIVTYGSTQTPEGIRYYKGDSRDMEFSKRNLYNTIKFNPSDSIQKVNVPSEVLEQFLLKESNKYQKGGATGNGNQLQKFQFAGLALNDPLRKEYAKRVVQEAERRIRDRDYITSEEVPQNVKEASAREGKLPYTCIGGACDVYKTAGVLNNINWSNTDFALHAKDYGFTANQGWGLKGIDNLEPGDMIQYKQYSNEQGKYYPSHSRIFLGIDANGKYRFFDNQAGGEQVFDRSELEYWLDFRKKDTEPNAVIFKVNPYNNNNPLGLTPEEKEVYDNKQDMIKKDSTSKSSYKWSISPTAKDYNENTKRVMDKFLNFANDNDKINDLVKKTGKSKEEIQDSLLNVFGELGAENNWTTSRGKGLGSLAENVVESVLTAVGGGKSYSVGPGQIKYSELQREEESAKLAGTKSLKEQFNITSPNDLYDVDKVLPLMTAMDLRDKQVLENWGKNNTLERKLFGVENYDDPFTIEDLPARNNSDSRLDDVVGRYSPYLRTQYSSIASGTTLEGDDDWKPFNERVEPNYVPSEYYNQPGTMRVKYERDPGSYPDIVEQNWRENLNRVMTRNADGAIELDEVVIPNKETGGLTKYQTKGEVVDERMGALQVRDNIPSVKDYNLQIKKEASRVKLAEQQQKNAQRKFNKLPKKEQEKILYEQYAQEHGDIKQYTPDSKLSKFTQSMVAPFTALTDLYQKGEVRDNLIKSVINNPKTANPYDAAYLGALAYLAAPAVASGVGTVATAAAPYIAADAVVPYLGTTLTGVNLGNIATAGFATHGAMNAGPDVAKWIDRPSWDNAENIFWDVAEIAPVVGPASKTIGEGVTAAGRALGTEEGLLSNAWKLNSTAEKLNNANSSYRVAGLNALEDFKNTGVLRSRNTEPGHLVEGTNFVLPPRPTSFPSFQKGYADMRYAKPEGSVVFETALPTFKRGDINPVTGLPIKGRHYAHRVINPETGAAMAEIPAADIRVFGDKPHWWKGYQQLDTSALPVQNTIPNVAESVVPAPWQMQDLPGLHLESTMDSPLNLFTKRIAKPLNKEGLISTEQALNLVKSKEGKERYEIVMRGFKEKFGDNIPKKMTEDDFVNFANESFIDKEGMIHVDDILKIIGKESGGADKVALIKQGLGETIPKKMDYNDFRKVVQDQIIPLDVQINPNANSSYGISSLGYDAKNRDMKLIQKELQDFISGKNTDISSLSKGTRGVITGEGNISIIDPNTYATTGKMEFFPFGTIVEKVKSNDVLLDIAYNKKYINSTPLENKTVTFSNKTKFGKGSSEHGNPDETLGHAHYLIDAETPDIINLTQLQSDALQGTYRIMPKTFKPEMAQHLLTRMQETQQKNIATLNKMKAEGAADYEIKQMQEIVDAQELRNALEKGHVENFTQKSLLDKDHQARFLQEFVNYAAQKGNINKVRVPTSETAANVQGYGQLIQTGDNAPGFAKLQEEISIATRQGNQEKVNELMKVHDEMLNTPYKSYNSEHQTILKKYSEQPKLIKKLFGQDAKIVTDSKGNTWYEFDIPESFKQGKGQIKAFLKGGELDFQKYAMKEMGGMMYANKDAGLPHKQSMQKYLSAQNNLLDFMKRVKVVGGPVPFDEYYRENIINPRNKS